ALDDAHLVAYQVDLDAAFDVGLHAAFVRQVVAALDTVTVDGDGLVLVRVDARPRDDDAGRVREVHGAGGGRHDLLGGVDGADDLLAGLHGGAVTDEHVHGRVGLVSLGAGPVDLERGRRHVVLGLGSAHGGAGALRQAQGGAGLGAGQLGPLFDELAAGDDGLHACRYQVGDQHLFGVDVADRDDAAVVTDRQQFDDAFVLAEDRQVGA